MFHLNGSYKHVFYRHVFLLWMVRVSHLLIIQLFTNYFLSHKSKLKLNHFKTLFHLSFNRYLLNLNIIKYNSNFSY